MESFLPNLSLLLPEAFLSVAAMLLLMYGVFRKNPMGGAVFGAVLALAATLLILLGTMPKEGIGFGGSVAMDGYALFTKGFVLVAGVAVLSMSAIPVMKHLPRFEFPVLMLFSIVGMLLMLSARDFLILYLGIELMSLSLYVLAAFDRDKVPATEAGLKYFVLGAIGSGMLLFGISLIYGFTGTIMFEDVARVIGSGASTGFLTGLVLVIVALCFKVSAVPFHMWTPDVYEGAPTPVTAFFASVPKAAALFVFVQLITLTAGQHPGGWQQILIFVSVVSMLVGAFGALTQTHIKRLLAYSSIGHVGYALVGLAVATPEGIQGMLIYVALYLAMTIGTFALILSLEDKGEIVDEISSLAGLARSHPLVALSLSIFLFSMVGIPPMAGFFGKFYVFLAAVKSGHIVLAVVGVLSSVVAAYYYLRLVKVMYMDALVAPLSGRLSWPAAFVLAVALAVTMGYFLDPLPLIDAAQAAAAAL